MRPRVEGRRVSFKLGCLLVIMCRLTAEGGGELVGQVIAAQVLCQGWREIAAGKEKWDRSN